MDSIVLFTIPHPIDGSVEFCDLGEQIRIRVHWPFDLSTDEWISLSANFPSRELASSIEDALDDDDPHTLRSAIGDRITFRSQGQRIEFDITTGLIPPTRFILPSDRDLILSLRDSLVRRIGRDDHVS